MIELDPSKIRAGVKMLLIGGFCIYQSIIRLKRSRLDQAMPFTPLRSLSAGAVKVKGKANSLQYHNSLLTNTKSAMSMVLVEQLRFSSWVIQKGQFYFDEWHLIDEHGDKIKLNPQTVEILYDPPFEKVIYPWSKNPEIEKAVRTLGFQPRINSFIGKLYKVSEYTVKPGDVLEIKAEANSADYVPEDYVKMELKDGPLSRFNLIQEKYRKTILGPVIFGGIGGIFLILGLLVSGGVIHSAKDNLDFIIIVIVSVIIITTFLYYTLRSRR